MTNNQSKIPLGVYEHFKGGTVKVIAIAMHSETLEQLVVYEKLYAGGAFEKGSIWVRPLSMFIERVEHKGSLCPRFKLV